MSTLLAHARAARILGESLLMQSELTGERAASATLVALGKAHLLAAGRMEEAVRQELADMPSSCTLDHRTIVTPKCAACGGPRTGGR